MEEKIVKYVHPNGEIAVLWIPERCEHAAVCVKSLPKVYHPKDRPWITVQNARTAELIDQIKRCPSGALRYELKNR